MQSPRDATPNLLTLSRCSILKDGVLAASLSPRAARGDTPQPYLLHRRPPLACPRRRRRKLPGKARAADGGGGVILAAPLRPLAAGLGRAWRFRRRRLPPRCGLSGSAGGTTWCGGVPLRVVAGRPGGARAGCGPLSGPDLGRSARAHHLHCCGAGALQAAARRRAWGAAAMVEGLQLGTAVVLSLGQRFSASAGMVLGEVRAGAASGGLGGSWCL